MKIKAGILLVSFTASFLMAGTVTAAKLQPVPKLSKAQMEKASEIYFDRCSGCHGVLRGGATGPDIRPEKTRKKSLSKLEKILYDGTDAGMPGWGKEGLISKSDIKLLAKYVQIEAPVPPAWDMKKTMASWKVHVPVSKRPTKAPSTNWQNYFGVVQRDAGLVTIVDGDSKEKIVTIPSGFATHILRASSTGRYLYAIGRDGKASMMDMWASPPNLVAEVRTGIDARSIDTSKYKGFEDKYVVVGNYWPSHYVILKGDTLEPIKIVG
ncbi:MAG: nitrite reductase, partial [Gammaproteobacteria bacterium]|nr:nitrite reductase [Gammaproteobacteria bacterium]